MGKDIDILSLNKHAWDNIADTFAKRKNPKIGRIFNYFCQKLPKKSRILDIGCGTGLPYSKYLTDLGHYIVGIDISSRMIQIAQSNIPQATFRELSMTDLDYNNEFMGIVASYSMLLLNPKQFNVVANKIVKALKDKGMLYLSLNEPWDDNMEGDGETIEEIMGELMYSRGYTKEEVLTSFIPLGMNLIQFERNIITSKEFGEERMMEFVFKRI